MGGKQRFGAQLFAVGNVFYHGARNAHAVVGGGPAPDLIQDQQALIGRLPQDGRDLVHFHHKGGLSGGQIVGGPHAGKYAVHDADTGACRRHKAADLRHQHNQRHLTHIGGFTGHIGTGQHGDLLLPVVQLGIIGDKGRPVQQLFHHRVPPFADLDLIRKIHRRAAVVVVQRHGGKAAQHIQSRHRSCRLLNARQFGCHSHPNLLVQLGCPFHGVLLGVQHPFLQLLDLLGNVPLRVGQGLLADIMGRHLVLEGVGNLDVIPKHPVVTDAQRADTGGFLFPFLYFRQNPADILGKVPGLIQRGVVSLPDDAAFLQRRFAVRVDRGPDQLRYIVQRVYVLFDLPQQGTLYLAQQLPDRRQAGRRHSQGNHILDRRVAVDYPGHQPFQVVYAVQLGG